jgi:hypothetical protein
MHRPSLLQIATRIHHALLRQIGTGIDIGAMLKEQRYADEVLYLCRACDDPEIRALVADFEKLSPVDEASGDPARSAASDGAKTTGRVRRHRLHGSRPTNAAVQARTHATDFSFPIRGRSAGIKRHLRALTFRVTRAH